MPLQPRRKRLLLLIAAVLTLAALTLTAWLRTAPRTVRLLPEASSYFYADFGTVRHLTELSQHPAIDRDAAYAQFVASSGFDFERDLDQIAIAMDNSRPGDMRTTVTAHLRYDHSRLPAYLRSLSRDVVTYGKTEIYEIPVDEHILRVSLLSARAIALSNEDDPGVIRGVIDRNRGLLPPWRAPNLIANHYTELPLFSPMWSIAQLSPQPKTSTPDSGSLAEGLGLWPEPSSTLLFSLVYHRSIEARAEFLFASQSEADRYATQAGTLLGVFRTLQNTLPAKGSDKDVRAVFDSISAVEQRQSVTLSATIPAGFLKKLVQEEARSNAPQSPPSSH